MMVINNNEIRNKSNAIVHNVAFNSPPSIAFPIWEAIYVVNVLDVEKMLVGNAVV